MTERPLVEKVLDVVLYAPVGVANTLRTDLPRIVSEGRSQLESRVKVAHWVGEMTVQFGRRALEQKLAARRGLVGDVDSADGIDESGPSGDIDHRRHQPVHAGHAHHQQAPFEGYDSLAATQVVQLLGRLPHGELRLVRDYEVDHRQRRTVLAKIDQLLDG
jgi:hypothetical protein